MWNNLIYIIVTWPRVEVTCFSTTTADAIKTAKPSLPVIHRPTAKYIQPTTEQLVVARFFDATRKWDMKMGLEIIAGRKDIMHDISRDSNPGIESLDSVEHAALDTLKSLALAGWPAGWLGQFIVTPPSSVHHSLDDGDQWSAAESLLFLRHKHETNEFYSTIPLSADTGRRINVAFSVTPWRTPGSRRWRWYRPTQLFSADARGCSRATVWSDWSQLPSQLTNDKSGTMIYIEKITKQLANSKDMLENKLNWTSWWKHSTLQNGWFCTHKWTTWWDILDTESSIPCTDK